MFKNKPVEWNDKRRQIGIKFRESTLEAMGLLDRNKFHTRTDFVSRIVENYLQKKGYLAKNPGTKPSKNPDKNLDKVA